MLGAFFYTLVDCSVAELQKQKQKKTILQCSTTKTTPFEANCDVSAGPRYRNKLCCAFRLCVWFTDAVHRRSIASSALSLESPIAKTCRLEKNRRKACWKGLSQELVIYSEEMWEITN